MIKRIFFDIDNTLIDWKNEYDEKVFSKTFEEEGIKYDSEKIDKISKAINIYENQNDHFAKDKMIEHINNQMNEKFGLDLLNRYLENTIKYATPENVSKEEENTIEYLSKKYELIIITNWFEEYQIRRMTKCGLMKYFKKIYAAEKYKTKPNPEIFKAAIGNLDPKECIMVGDNYEVDIEGAKKCGIKTIWITKSTKQVNEENCIKVEKIEKIRNIL